jgi:hypothetical protein
MNVPASQKKHEESPETFAKYPGEHEVHVDCPSKANLPTPQSRQPERVMLKYIPVSQTGIPHDSNEYSQTKLKTELHTAFRSFPEVVKMTQFPTDVGYPESHKGFEESIMLPFEVVKEEVAEVEREPPTQTEDEITDMAILLAVLESITVASLPPEDPPSNQL